MDSTVMPRFPPVFLELSRVAPFTPFARRHELVGVTREQFLDGLRVNTLARVDVFTHDLADRGLIVAAGVVLSEPRRGGNNATKDRKLSAHNASSENGRANWQFALTPSCGLPGKLGKLPGSAGILACLLRSVGHCRKPSRQGCLRSQVVCPTLAPRFSFFQAVATRH